MHESIHACLVVYFRVDGLNATTTYPQIVEDWNVKQNDMNGIHHDEMARSLVSQVGYALEVYGISKGYKLDKQFYQDMSWGGLPTTDTFKKLPANEQKRILNTLAVELTGEDIDGNVKQQKGKKAGC